MKLKCDNCRYKKMCYRRYNPIGDKYSHTDNCEYYEKYEPRPHGKWIVHDRPSLQYGCNICGNLTNINSNFCPNCGADMRKRDMVECMDEDAKQASIPYSYNAPQHDWKCGYPDEKNQSTIWSKSKIVPDYRDEWRWKEGDDE